MNGETRWYQVRFTGEYARRLQQQGFGQGDGIDLAGYDKSFDATKADGTVTRLDRINGVNAKLIQKSRRKQGSDVSR